MLDGKWLIPELPDDVKLPISRVPNGLLRPQSELFFADDTGVVRIGGEIYYYIGLSHVPFDEFNRYPRPNGTLRKNLKCRLVRRKSEMTHILAEMIALTYNVLEDVAGIYICSSFNQILVARELYKQTIPMHYADEITNKLHVVNGASNRDSRKIPCRLYSYKQKVGELLVLP